MTESNPKPVSSPQDSVAAEAESEIQEYLESASSARENAADRAASAWLRRVMRLLPSMRITAVISSEANDELSFFAAGCTARD